MPKGKMDDSSNLNITNPNNEKIVKEFMRLIDQIKIQIDNAPATAEYVTNNFRLKQITAALNIIKKYPKEIKSGSDLKDIKGIGKGTISRIDEILKTGKLAEIKTSVTEEKFSKAIEELQQIHGIGHKTAYDLVVRDGIKTIKELEKAYNDGVIELNDIILTGLKYHNIYKQSIPRAEVTSIKEYLEKEVKSVNKDLSITICGSYRRGKDTSNDIDVLLTHPSIKTKIQLSNQDEENYLLKFVEKLKKDKFILDDLTDKDYEMKYMGYCQLSKNDSGQLSKNDSGQLSKKDNNKLKKYPVRRIDIRYIPYDSYYTALLYFTGSGPFNQKMRKLAEQLGYLLNEYGLYKLVNDKKKRIKIKSEEDVFKVLGMEYLDPSKRI